MKIILYRDLPNLGEEGDVKIVADGYARNYLIPRKFAVPYTKATEIELAQKQQAIARRKEGKAKTAAGDKARIEDLKMELALSAGEKGKLFGSVSSAAIVGYLHSQGIEVERKRVELPDGGIKTVGSHAVKIKLYGGEEASLAVEVFPSGAKPVETEVPSKARIDPIHHEDELMGDDDSMNQIAAEDLTVNPVEEAAAEPEAESENQEG